MAVPTFGYSFVDWWANTMNGASHGVWKKLNIMVILVAWTICKERNDIVFEGEFSSMDRLVD